MAIVSFIRWIFGLSLAIFLAGFSILNRESVTLNWGPLESTLDLPIYAIALGFMILGFIIGSLIVWLNYAPLRQTRRKQKKQIKDLEKELDAVNENIPLEPIAQAQQNKLIPK